MDSISGLSESEVLARRAAGQGNGAPLQTSRSYLQILSENFFTFINCVLFVLGVALVALGRPSDALMSVGVVLANTLVNVVQEVRAKRTLDRIALITRPRVTVLRAGQERTVDPGQIVLGDVLVARPGDQIVVDGQVVGAGTMDVDESLLTGESDLIPKRAGDPVYSGSFVVTGQGLYEAQKVGAHSFANQLAADARAFRRVYTPLQRQINLVIQIIVLLAVYLEVLLAIDAAIQNIPIVSSVRMSVVIVGLVPNGLFLAIALAYAIGAVRMVGQGALVQQSNAVESLSNVDVLCLDKTGTLTANQIRLHDLHPLAVSESELRRILGDYAASTTAGNRTIAALVEACGGQARRVCAEVPFSSARKWSALAFDEEALRGVYVLGAPEVLWPYIASEQKKAFQTVVDQWTAAGLRVVLFLGSADRAPGALYNAAGQPCLSDQLIPLGVVSLQDKLRSQARETLAEFVTAGVRLKIISGDHPQTVAALAKRVGLGPELQMVSGQDLGRMDGAQMTQLVEETTIFGRITPQQKEMLVQALQQRAHYVAMIGDGVNDVLSLKRANLGIAMQSGAPATRGVADIILLNDSFAALPQAFLEGQRILNGMQDILKLFLTRVLYSVLLIISLGIIGGFPFTPKTNSLLSLLTVGIPTIALAAWARPRGVPRRNLLGGLLHFVLPAALTLGMAGLGVYLFYFVSEYNAILALNPSVETLAATIVALPYAQSALLTFTVLAGLLLLPFVEPPTSIWVGGDMLSGDWRPSLLALVLLLGYAAILASPGLRQFFELAPLTLPDYGLIGLVVVGWALLLRLIWRMRLLERFLTLDWAQDESD